jgi:hypothetical protein
VLVKLVAFGWRHRGIASVSSWRLPRWHPTAFQFDCAACLGQESQGLLTPHYERLVNTSNCRSPTTHNFSEGLAPPASPAKCLNSFHSRFREKIQWSTPSWRIWHCCRRCCGAHRVRVKDSLVGLIADWIMDISIWSTAEDFWDPTSMTNTSKFFGRACATFISRICCYFIFIRTITFCSNNPSVDTPVWNGGAWDSRSSRCWALWNTATSIIRIRSGGFIAVLVFIDS